MVKLFLKIGVSLFLLAFFAIRADLEAMSAAFTGIQPAWYILSLLAALSGPLIMSGKYRLLIARTSLDLPFFRLVAVNFIARFYALFLPSALGPEAVRWYKITKNKKGKSFFLAATIVERLFFLLSLFACGAIPLLLAPDPTVQTLAARLWPALAITSLGFMLALTYFFWPGLQRVMQHRVITMLRLSQESKVRIFLGNFSLKNLSLRIVGMLLAYTLLWQASFLARMYFLFLALDLPFGFLDVTWMGSLVMLLQVVPVSFGGLGVREGAFAYLFTLHGVQTEAGVVVGMLFFSQMLILCFVGWLCQLFEGYFE
ncbi:MAG TPA: flippase-like domain-containing protein [Desulfonatronum sp.]|nr:flippase-like domain-containing protein [Desulfonatronum sp.]